MSLDEFTPSMADVMRKTARKSAARAGQTAAPEPVVIEVLSLSAGGQYGAFGAGFLRGWSENPASPRPDFDLVTGVSAGGMLAPVAFGGSAHDASFDRFRGLDRGGLYHRRPLLALIRSPSYADGGKLEKLLRDQLTRALIEDIARRHREGARLLLMATNLDTTEATIFDLGAMAASDLPEALRRDCMAEAMLATSAIPGLFPPRNIDGMLYADGGLRDQIFLRDVEAARLQVARETGRPIRINATLIVNGALAEPDGPVEDRLISYFQRSLLTLSDEVLRDSINEAITFAEANRNWTLRGVVSEVDLARLCPGADLSGTFESCVTRELFDAGRALGRAHPIEFKSARELRALAEAL